MPATRTGSRSSRSRASTSRVQEVRFDQVGVGRQRRAQQRGQVAVDLDADEASDGRREGTRERPAARADLQEGVVGRGAERGDEPRDPGRLEEVLAEALACARQEEGTAWAARGRDGSRLRPLPVGPGSSSSPASPSPRQWPLFDLLDLLLAETEVVANLVDQGLANHRADVVDVVAVFLDRPLEDRDAVRQRVPPARTTRAPSGGVPS